MNVRFSEIKKEVEGLSKSVGGATDDITVVAVSKTVDIDAIEEAYAQGSRDFGENRPDELKRKALYFMDKAFDIRWHFIGNIQSRQIKKIVEHASLIHSVEKFEHAKKIDGIAKEFGKVQKILIEVNVSGEESKGGLSARELPEFLRKVKDLKNVEAIGIMTMAPIEDEEHKNLPSPREVFNRAKSLIDENREGFCLNGRHEVLFSAGMTNDWQEAILEGSTCVRIGRAIFSA